MLSAISAFPNKLFSKSNSVKNESIKMKSRKIITKFQEVVTAGPFIRFDKIENSMWIGSVVVITHSCVQPPLLHIQDRTEKAKSIIEIVDRVFWKYSLTLKLEYSDAFYEFYIAEKSFKIHVPNNELSWNVKFFPYIDHDIYSELVEDDFIVENPTLNLYQIDQSTFHEISQLPSLKKWLEINDIDKLRNFRFNPKMEEEISKYFFESYIKLFNGKNNSSRYYRAFSVGNILSDEIQQRDISSVEVIRGLKRINTLFMNLFFFHSSISTQLKEVTKPYQILRFAEGIFLSIDVEVTRTKEQFFNQSTYRALTTDLIQACNTGVKHLVVTINSAELNEVEQDKKEILEETFLNKMWSYVDIRNFFSKGNSFCKKQLSDLLFLLNDIQNEKDIRVTILFNSLVNRSIHLLSLSEDIPLSEGKNFQLIPIDQKLMNRDGGEIHDNQVLTFTMQVDNSLKLFNDEGDSITIDAIEENVDFSPSVLDRVSWVKNIW
ncbi:MAG: hypothetical protein VX777_02320 [Chlamydiota bacterium]|nr:hypothetical protein [Chlamydiota bacterium]